MPFTDKSITCADCGTTFTFSASEQELYQKRGYTNDPKRCEPCREARKSRQGGGGSRGFGGGGRRYGGGGGFGGPREMHTTTCSSCGKEAQVPFKPRGDKPVYCRDCYASRSGR